MKKGFGKLILVISLIMMTAFITYGVFNIVYSPYWDSVYAPVGYLSLASFREAESDNEIFTNAQACEDVDYLIKQLKRVHPKCIDSVPTEVMTQAEYEKNNFGQQVTSYDIWQATSRIINKMNDSHCVIKPSFPMKYLAEQNTNGELHAINGISVDDIFVKNKDLISYESENWGKSSVTGLAKTAEGLKFLGIDSDNLTYTYKFSDGTTIDKHYTADDFYNYAEDSETSDTPYFSRYNPEKNYAVMTLESCVYDTDFKQFVYDFFIEISEQNIENIVIDLRDNNGGTSEIADEILMYLDQKSFKTPSGQWRLGPYMMKWDSEEVNITNMDDESTFSGKVYVLTSQNTFDSAVLLAEILGDNGFAEIVGETSGTPVDFYSDVAIFQTPNSVLTFQIPTKHFERIDKSKGFYLEPDYPCDKDKAESKVCEFLGKK